MKHFEDKFMDIQAGMISLCLEYVKGQVEKIYIYGVSDSLISFNVFYKIKGKIIQKHQVNEYLDANNKIDSNLQSQLLCHGVEDLEEIVELCKKHNHEHPTEMWLVYDAETNSLDAKYSYEARYEKDLDLLLDPVDEFGKWFEEVKAEIENG
ncbi:TPA: hypothetical protein U2C71_001190 [Streptococcus suis]|nr:hypothetical protein [Streptococcus suis]